MPNLV